MKTSLFNCSEELIQHIGQEEKLEFECDVAVFGSDEVVLDSPLRAKTVVCPTNAVVDGKVTCDSIISCGMDQRSTLSLSCIGEDECLLTVCRTIHLPNGTTLQPCELWRPYYNDMSVDDNIIFQAFKLLQ